MPGRPIDASPLLSTQILAAYMMKKYSWGLRKSMEFLSSRRPDLDLKPAFMQQLLSFERRLMALSKQTFSSDWSDRCNVNRWECEELLLRNTYINSQMGPLAEIQRLGVDEKKAFPGFEARFMAKSEALRGVFTVFKEKIDGFLVENGVGCQVGGAGHEGSAPRMVGWWLRRPLPPREAARWGHGTLNFDENVWDLSSRACLAPVFGGFRCSLG